MSRIASTLPSLRALALGGAGIIAVILTALLFGNGPSGPRVAWGAPCTDPGYVGNLYISVQGAGTVGSFTATISPTITDDGTLVNGSLSYNVPVALLNVCATDTNPNRASGYDVSIGLSGDAA